MSDPRTPALDAIKRLMTLITAAGASGPEWLKQAQEAHRDAVAELKTLLVAMERQGTAGMNADQSKQRERDLVFFSGQLGLVEEWGRQQFGENLKPPSRSH
jgi:hypothetical protein